MDTSKRTVAIMSTPYDVYDGPNDIPVCPICGSEDGEWVDCPECGGEGGFRGDEVDPDLGHNDFVRCEMCHGNGGWYECRNGTSIRNRRDDGNGGSQTRS